MTERKFCGYGLSNLELEGEGKYQPCCGGWLKDVNFFCEDEYSSAIEAWNSEKFVDFRKSLLEGNYKYCNGVCFFLSNPEMHTNTVSEMLPAPRVLKLVGDRTCNLNCVMCRDQKLTTMPEVVQRMFEDVKECREFVERISLSGQGDLFFSKYCRDWLQSFKREDYPKLIELYVDTNGICMTPEFMLTIPDAVSIMSLHISIDAATKETYEKIRRGGKWEKLMDNLKHIQDWYPVDREIGFGFCVSSLNYQEILKFVEMLDSLYGLERVYIRFEAVEPRGYVKESTYQQLKLTEEMVKSIKKQLSLFPKKTRYAISGITL